MLAPWKKSYDQARQHIKKQRHYFANRGPCSQSYGFSSGHLWVWELDHKEGWVPNSWCFWTVVLEKTESPWNARRSNQSTLKEIRPEYSLEGLILKLNLQYFGYLMQRTGSLEPVTNTQHTLMLGLIEGRRRRRRQRMRWLDVIIDLMDMSLSNFRTWWRTGKPVCCSPWCRRFWHDRATELNWKAEMLVSNKVF